MSFFSNQSSCIWPKFHSLEIFIDKKENNHFVFEFDLWQPLSNPDASSLANFFKTVPTRTTYLLLPEAVVTVKSFIYESSIEKITKDEVSAMLSSAVDFKVDPDLFSYKLEENAGKTIIRVIVADPQKISILKNNLDKIGLKITDYQPVSLATVNTISQFYDKTYSIIYPLDQPQYLFILANGNKIFLTDTIKGVSIDIQKKINYSKLYFGKIVSKLFIPSDFQTQLDISDKIDRNPFDESKISSKLGKSANFPLPVLSFFDKNLYKQMKQSADIIKLSILENFENKVPKMENDKKKNPLLILLVFILSLSVVSAILWFILNRDTAGGILSPNSQEIPTEEPVITQAPTATPTPITELDKEISIRVLNATSINGLAGLVKSDIDALDFENVTAGNSNEELSQNTIRYKDNLESVPAYFQQKLPKFSDATFEATLKEDDTYDVIVIVAEDVRVDN